MQRRRKVTTWGIDISNHQEGLAVDRVKDEGYTFVIAKATEGGGFRDKSYPGFRDRAIHSGLLFAAYHFLRSDSPMEAQAQNLAGHIGDKDIPIMIDAERTDDGKSRPNLAHVIEFTRACQHRGLKLTMLYLPQWWWNELGRPALPTSFTLVKSDYGKNPAGFGSVIYPGDNSLRWNGYGGDTVDILQFGSRGRLSCYPGKDVDIDAYRGTPEQLAETGIFFVA